MEDYKFIINDIRIERNLKQMWIEKFYVLKAWIQILNRGINLKEIIENKNAKRVIIYGCDEIMQLFMEACQKEEIEIAAIADDRISGGKYEYLGIPMLSLKEVMELCEENLLLITANNKDKEKLVCSMGGYLEIVCLRELMEPY